MNKNTAEFLKELEVELSRRVEISRYSSIIIGPQGLNDTWHKGQMSESLRKKIKALCKRSRLTEDFDEGEEELTFYIDTSLWG